MGNPASVPFPPPEAVAASPEAIEEIALTRWVTINAQSERAIRMEQRFLALYPQIRLNNILVAEGTDYATAFASGTNPDIGGCGLPDMAKFAYAGVALPLDDRIDAWEEAKAFYPHAIEALCYGSEQYAIPAYGYTMMLYYNKALFEQAGIEGPPGTWEELLDTAKRLTVPEKGQWGVNLLLSQWREWWFEYFVWQAGGDLTVENPDGTLALTFDDPAIATAIEFYRALIREQVTQPDLTQNYESMQRAFATGNAAMTLNGSDGITAFLNYGMDIDDIGMAMLPVGPSGEPVTQLGGQCLFIFSNVDGDTADAAWSWISFSLGKEEQERVLMDGALLGGASPIVPIRGDVDLALGSIRPDFQRAVEKSLPYARMEFYGKGIVGAYVDAAVYRSAMNPDADIEAIFLEEQEIAQREAVEKFNEDILSRRR